MLYWNRDVRTKKHHQAVASLKESRETAPFCSVLVSVIPSIATLFG